MAVLLFQLLIKGRKERLNTTFKERYLLLELKVKYTEKRGGDKSGLYFLPIAIGKMSVFDIDQAQIYSACCVKIRGLLLWTVRVYVFPYVHATPSLSTFCVVLHTCSLVVCSCV
jgi:hypothetical protein